MKHFNGKLKYIVIGMIALILIIIMIVIFIGRKTYNCVTDAYGNCISGNITGIDKNYLNISCDKDVVSAGDTISCSITGRSAINYIYSVNANYIFDNAVFEYIDFELANDDSHFEEIYAKSDKGFAVVSSNKITRSFGIGTVTFKVKELAIPGNSYNFGLENIEFTKDDYKMIRNTYLNENFNVRVKSDNNNLESLKISNIDNALNIEYSSEELKANEISFTVDSSVNKINLGLKTVDNNAKIDSDDSVTLLYGENVLEIPVMAENGDIRTYKVNAFRKYEYTNDKYMYDKDDNYLYTGMDTELNQIAKNIPLEDYLSLDMADGKLLIKKDDKVISSIGLGNFSFEGTRENNILYVLNNTSYDKFDKMFKPCNLEVEIEKNGDIVHDGDKVRIFHEDKILEELEVKTWDLEHDSDLNIDYDKMIIKNLKAGMTVKELKDKFYGKNNISKMVKNYNGVLIKDEEIIKTNDILVITYGGRDYCFGLSVYGDINGDGQVLFNDFVKLYNYIVLIDTDKGFKMNDAEIYASDIVYDGRILFNDFVKLYNYVAFLGTEKEISLEV